MSNFWDIINKVFPLFALIIMGNCMFLLSKIADDVRTIGKCIVAVIFADDILQDAEKDDDIEE